MLRLGAKYPWRPPPPYLGRRQDAAQLGFGVIGEEPLRSASSMRPVTHPTVGSEACLFRGAGICGHAFVQNVRRGHHDLGVDAGTQHLRLAAAFDERADMI